jgi:hypothetical protein
MMHLYLQLGSPKGRPRGSEQSCIRTLIGGQVRSSIGRSQRIVYASFFVNRVLTPNPAPRKWRFCEEQLSARYHDPSLQLRNRLMEINARKLAQVIRAAAEHDCVEKDFRKPVEEHLIQLAKQLEIDLVPHTEVTLGTSGRADTIYNRFIVEWERPGFIKASNKTANNTHTIAQAKDYGDSLFWRTREKPGRIVACCSR